jgi:hypothetical protein
MSAVKTHGGRMTTLSRRERRMRRHLTNPQWRVCGCGVCGLEFPPTKGRSIHPECPSRTGERTKTGGRVVRRRKLLAEPPRPRRCRLCEGMPHVRPPGGCPVCRQPYAPERARRSDAAPACALGAVL